MALAVGFALGAFYDVFRIFRVFARSEKRQVIWQDIFVCFVAAVVSFLVALAVNWGEVRFYLLAGAHDLRKNRESHNKTLKISEEKKKIA